MCHRHSLLTASYLHGLCVCVSACVVAGKKKDVRWHITSKFGVFHIITPGCHASPWLDSPKMKLWLVSTHTHQTLFKKFSAISVVGCGETEIFLLPKLVLYQLTVCVCISVCVYLSIRSADFSYLNALCACVFHVFGHKHTPPCFFSTLADIPPFVLFLLFSSLIYFSDLRPSEHFE